jgi:bifunctional diaminopimelate decarboxylase / aspartate kinase
MPVNNNAFVVLKFGGTSVASAAKWAEITLQAKRVIASNRRCWLTVSAVTKVTNLLENSLKEAVESNNDSHNVSFDNFQNLASYDKIVSIHTKLWSDLGLGTDEYKEEFQTLLGLLNGLKRFLIGIQLCGEISPRMRAQVCSFGELMSSFIGLQALKKSGLSTAKRVDARQCLISRNINGSSGGGYVHEEDAFLQACVDPSYDPDIVKRLGIENAECVITQGFIASTANGHTCLLGRGGSDTSAALFASLIGAERLEIWTDVHGLFTSDPRNVKGTRLIKETTYRVAQELASMGAKVLHPRCLVPASWGGIPVEIHNTEDPNGPCTRIVANKSSTNGGNGKTTLSPMKPRRKFMIVNNGGDTTNFSNDIANGDGKSILNKPNVLAVTCRNGQGLVHIDSVDMWGESGFLAKVFQPFREMDVSVDLVATSQYAVSLTLDHIPGGFEGPAFARVIYQLKRLGTVRTRYPCSVVSIVGEYLRSGLPEIGNAMTVLKNHEVHLMTQSCEDLNMSFVVDTEVANDMVQSLHHQFFSSHDNTNGQKGNNEIMGDTWEKLKNSPPTPPSIVPAGSNGNADNYVIQPNSVNLNNLSPNSRKRYYNLSNEEIMLGTFSLSDNGGTDAPHKWWLSPKVRDTLITLGSDGSGHYVYDETTILERATNVQTFLHNVVDKFYYAMKANSNQRVLSLIASTGFGMECVSVFEVRYVRRVLGKNVPILFSPNFCSLKEYKEAIQLGAQVIVDDIEIIKQDPTVFKGKKIAFRVDPVTAEKADDSHGHHKHVRTSGAGQKFGLPLAEVSNAAKQAQEFGILVVGLHSHVGSGVLKPTVWKETACTLSNLLLDENTQQRKVEFKNVEWLDLGGGLGVAGQNPNAITGVNLNSVANALTEISAKLKSLQPKPVHLHMEPGRYLVSEGGVLVTNVTQIRQKHNHRFVGVATGMNTLIRPALYSAWHDIVNLSFAKKTECSILPPDNYYEKDTELTTSHVVGPICETADVLGHSRNLPKNTAVGDVILIANAGAYGHVMASNYNMREPASEIIIELEEEDFVQE